MDKRGLITIYNKDGTIDKIEGDSYKQFRVLWFDEEGCPRVYGKAPLREIRKPFREWAENWAEEHRVGIEATLRQYRPEITSAETIIALEEVMKGDIKPSEQKIGNRDITVAYYMVGQLLKAMIVAFKKAAERITSVWEFPQSVLDKSSSNSVLVWLFARR